jgi:uncharacterized protein (AIM24 family)
VALTCRGKPIKFDVAATPCIVDPNAAVAWTTSVQHEMRTSFKVGNLIGKGSGEAFQLKLSGNGTVYVQASEVKL